MDVSKVSTDDSTRIVHEAIAGNVALISTMRLWSDDEFAGLDRSQKLTLTSRATVRALREFQRGHVTDAQAREWAEFMQRGCFDGSNPLPTESLWIEWDPDREDEVATAVMRLTDLGDIIDGEFRPGEIDQLVALLEFPVT